jgi:hypothetical protein
MTKTPARGAKKYKKVPLFGRVDKRRLPRPDQSERMKALWEDPEHRAKHAAAISASHKDDPTKHSRAGIPTGHTRETVAPLWERARELADRFITIMKDKGELPRRRGCGRSERRGRVRSPCARHSTRQGRGRAEGSLRARGRPLDQKIKIQAINTVLNFTKSKPESKSKLTLNKAEDFLDEIIRGDDARRHARVTS